jgi:hypothetical protein
MIPPFNNLGYLPPGIYEVTWDEFWERFSTNIYRKQMLTGLRLALNALKVAGCQQVYIGGSFVTDKEKPNDYDGCFEVFGIDENKIDPIFLIPNLQAQKDKFYGESLPNSVMVGFFQNDINRQPKGIISLNPSTVP